ncbi:O-antigen ligase/Tfp pilus assembly protein PilF [Flavobacterium sp. CG_9.10]|uniref:O-antigen ligase family protein n=1 Tax=Flavobacterium sp. CG_9.10 TaxID=2787729 RepID=UPI0018C99A12|nr:O-antigen ligase family protein [Flavobacterium sp. CG_9.10]MBG6111312.1 O-antigen ligase/Tfp pilus assembly protein PilF [Flavobacterium sp. CG_9.10]
MKAKLVTDKLNTQEPTSDTNYFDLITLFFIIGFLIIDFLPQFRSIEIIAPQYLYLSILNISIGVFIYYNPAILTQNLISIYKKSHIVKACLLFIVFSGVSLFAARNLSLGIVNLIRIVIVFCTLINLSILLNNRLHLIYKITFLIGISIFIQSFQAFYDFVQFSKTDSILHALANLKGNTGNINIFSASLSIKIPFLLIGIVHFTKWKKWFLVFVLLLATVLIFLTGSRAAFLSLFFETLIFILLYLKINPLNKINILTVSYIIVPLIISFFTANLIFEKGKGTGRYESVSSRVTQVGNVKDASIHERLLYWNNALKMIKNKPLLGIGLGNWQIESIPYERKTNNDHTISANTHNDFLEITAETGILNGLLYLYIFIIAFCLNLKIFFKSENRELTIIAILSTLLLLSYGIDATFNFPMYRPTMQLWFSFFLALSIINTSSSEEFLKSYSATRTSTFIIIISLFTLYFSFKTFKAYQLENDIKANFQTNKFTLRADEIAHNLPQYPNVFSTSEPFATYAGKYYIEEKNYKQASKYLNIGNKINPYLGRTELYKHLIATGEGRNDSAYFYAKKALDIRPRNRDYYIAAINSGMNLKDTTGIIKIHNIYTQYNNYPEVWINTSSALNQSGYNNKKLISFIDKGLKTFPGDSLLSERKKIFEKNIFENQAMLFFNNLKYDKALDSYKKALNKDPNNVFLMQNIGICFYNLKQYLNAISYLKKSLISADLKDGKAEYLLGMSYFFIKNKENCCKYLNLAKNKNYGNAQEIMAEECK